MAIPALQTILDRIDTWPVELQERAIDALETIEAPGDAEAWQLSDEDVEELRHRMNDRDEPTLSLDELDRRLDRLRG